MPNLVRTYKFENISKEDLYKKCEETFDQMKIKGKYKTNDFQTEVKKGVLIGYIPSIWGWGKLDIVIKVYPLDNSSIMELNGYIGQMYTAPITSRMNKFLNILQKKIANDYSYNFKGEDLTKIPIIRKAGKRDFKTYSNLFVTSSIRLIGRVIIYPVVGLITYKIIQLIIDFLN